MNEEILNKLKKLLNLSKGATGAEAEAALEKATALAAKHNIDLAIAAIDNAPIKEEFVEGEYVEKRRKCVAQRFISKLLTDHFNVKIIYSGSRYHGQKILFLGRKSDVDFALYAQDFLKRHMMDSWDYYKASHKVETRFRATFFDGFWRGLDTKLKEAKRKQEQDSFGELPTDIKVAAESRYAIILQDEKKERENFVNKKYPKLRHVQAARLNVYGGNAAEAGFSTGYSTNINRPLMGQLAIC